MRLCLNLNIIDSWWSATPFIYCTPLSREVDRRGLTKMLIGEWLLRDRFCQQLSWTGARMSHLEGYSNNAANSVQYSSEQ